MSKRDAEIYREAARFLFTYKDYYGACEAIWHCEPPSKSIWHQPYAKLFRPHGGRGFWWDDHQSPASTVKEWRALSLLFMAAIAEDE